MRRLPGSAGVGEDLKRSPRLATVSFTKEDAPTTTPKDGAGDGVFKLSHPGTWFQKRNLEAPDRNPQYLIPNAQPPTPHPGVWCARRDAQRPQTQTITRSRECWEIWEKEHFTVASKDEPAVETSEVTQRSYSGGPASTSKSVETFSHSRNSTHRVLTRHTRRKLCPDDVSSRSGLIQH